MEDESRGRGEINGMALASFVLGAASLSLGSGFGLTYFGDGWLLVISRQVSGTVRSGPGYSRKWLLYDHDRE